MTRLRPFARLQILDERAHPALRGLGRRRAAGTGHSQRGRDRAREGLDLRRAKWQPVIGFRAGIRRRALDSVEAIELRAGALDTPPRRKGARMPQPAVASAEEIGVEREDDVGLLDRVPRIDVLAEREPAAFTDVVASERLPLHPLRLRKAAEELLELGAERRRRDGLGQDPDAGALLACCAETTVCIAATNESKDRISPRCVIVCERSGS